MEIRKTGFIALLAGTFAVMGVKRCYKARQDFRQANQIKMELLKYITPEYKSFVYKEIENACKNIPSNNKTAYWEDMSRKIHQKLILEEQRRYNLERIKNEREHNKHKQLQDSIYIKKVKELANSQLLKNFLAEENKEKEKFLKKYTRCINAKTIYLRLDKTFPSLDLNWIKTVLNNDDTWIKTRLSGYKRINNDYIPEYSPKWKNCHGFFEPEIKEDSKSKYLVFKYYAELNS